MPFRFDNPELLALLLLAIPIVLLGRHNLSTSNRRAQTIAIALRLIVLLLLVLMLAGFAWVQTYDAVTVVAVVDRSESVRRFVKPPDAIADQLSTADEDNWVEPWLLDAAKERQPDDTLGLITFDGKSTVRSMPNSSLSFDAEAIRTPTEGTDTASAVRIGIAVYEPNTAKRMVLISDGNDTGNSQALIAAAEEAAGAGVIIDVLPLDYSIDREVVVDQLIAPSEAREGQTISLRVVLRSTRRATGRLFIRHDSSPIDLNGPQEGVAQNVKLEDWAIETQADQQEAGQYVLARTITVPVTKAGVNQFQSVFEPDDKDDQLIINNTAETFTLVRGKGRLLVVDNVDNNNGRFLPNTLKRRGFELDVIRPAELPSTLNELARYDAIIMQNVPADMVPIYRQEMIRKYVQQLGGGFVMIGGPAAFGAGGWANSTIDEILPVHCQLPEKKVIPLGALVLVIDRSGSMNRPVPSNNNTVSRRDVAVDAACLAVSTLFPKDQIGVVAYAGDANWVVPLQPVDNGRKHFDQIKSIQAGGGTDAGPGLDLALKALAPLRPAEASVKHIILLSDGDSKLANWNSLTARMRANNITLSTVAIGSANHNLLQNLATMGEGTFHAVPDYSELPYIFVKEARTIRKHLIRELTFAPGLRAGSPVTADLTAVPQLNGFIMTGPRKNEEAFTPIIGPEGEPIFAHWQVGLGRTAAFTSDANSEWASNWLSWSGYEDFWSNVVRYVGRPTVSMDYQLSHTFDGKNMRIKVESESIQKAASLPDITATIINPAGEIKSVTLQPTGAGIHETLIPAEAVGSYITHVMIDAKGGNRQTLFGGATRKTGPELRRFKSNRSLLTHVAQITGGRVLETSDLRDDLLFERTHNLEPSRSIRTMWRKLLVLLLIFLFIDIANRRIQWREWFERGVTLPRPPPAPTPAMQTAGASVPQPKQQREKRPRKQKTQTAPPTATKPTAPELPVEEQPKPKPTSGTTSRLLGAKRRARDRYQNDKDTDTDPPDRRRT